MYCPPAGWMELRRGERSEPLVEEEQQYAPRQGREEIVQSRPVRPDISAIQTVRLSPIWCAALVGSACGPGHQTRASREAGSASPICHEVALARDARV